MIPGIVAEDEETVAPLPYSASAVQIDDFSTSTAIVVASQTIADSHLFTASVWFKVRLSDIPGIFELSTGTAQSYANVLRDGTLQVILNDPTGANGLTIASASGAVSSNAWHHLFVRTDLNHPAGAKVYDLYLDGVDVKDLANCIDMQAAFSLNVNGREFVIPANPSFDATLLQAADYWIAVGQDLDPGTYLTKFRSPAGNALFLGSTGQLPSGTTPSYFFSGDRTSFAINKGAGDAATLIGALTDVTGPP